MNSIKRIQFILLVVQCFDLQQQIAVKARQVQVLLRIFAAFFEVARIYISVVKRQKNRPLLWEKKRTSSYWEKECQDYSAMEFKNQFRMEKGSFIKLCDMLQELEKADTNCQKAVPLQKRVAIALYALGSSAEYHTVANLFGVSNSSVRRIVNDFCLAAWKCLMPIYLNDFPLTAAKIQNVVKDFEEMGFPQCLGALDGCHIEIKPKETEAKDYRNYKGCYSVVLLALVDARYRFLYINVGSPGRCNDSRIYESSLLKAELSRCTLLHSMRKTFNNVEVPVVIIADSAFRLSRTLLKPFPINAESTLAQREFNLRLSRCRRVVENAFGHLKGRFRRIGKGLDNRIENTNTVIKACCVLHNFLIAESDEVADTWLSDAIDTEEQRGSVRRNNRISNLGEAYRNALSQHFSQNAA